MTLKTKKISREVEVQRRWKEHEEKRKAHQKEVKILHFKRRMARSVEESEALEALINKKVTEWNRWNPFRSRDYHDLHGMTKKGAEEYVKWHVDLARKRGGKTVLRFETGRGNNSPNKIPAIKVALMAIYGKKPFCRTELEPGNDGVLRMVIL